MAATNNQQMYNEDIDNYLPVLEFVSAYHFWIEFIPECYKTQEMCDEAINRCFVAFIYISN